MNPSPRRWPDQVAADIFAEELRELAAGDRLVVGDTHQDQALLLRERPHLVAQPGRGTDRFSKDFSGAVLPAAGDRDHLIEAAAQLVADVVNDQIEIALPADDARQHLARYGLDQLRRHVTLGKTIIEEQTNFEGVRSSLYWR